MNTNKVRCPVFSYEVKELLLLLLLSKNSYLLPPPLHSAILHEKSDYLLR